MLPMLIQLGKLKLDRDRKATSRHQFLSVQLIMYRLCSILHIKMGSILLQGSNTDKSTTLLGFSDTLH